MARRPASGPLSEHNLRYRIVKRLSGYPGADVAFSALVDGQKAFFGKRLQQGLELLKPISMAAQRNGYQAILSISGHGHPTNLVAALSSGCVPVICLHWEPHEMRLFKPWVHYVPIDPSLNGLEAALEWIWADTARAERLALAAQNGLWRSFGHKAIDRALSSSSRGLRRATAPAAARSLAKGASASAWEAPAKVTVGDNSTQVITSHL